MTRLLRSFVLAAAAAALAFGVPPTPAGALHTEPPDRTYTYEVRTRGEVRADVEQFAGHVARTLADVRGWSMGGSLAYQQVSTDAHFIVWLASPAEVEAFGSVCSSRYSCRVGDNVIINDERWRTATSTWPFSLDDYQHYVVNHEMGHWLGEGHWECPGAGQPAPVMMQQSKDAAPCEFNVWPLPAERQSVADRHGVIIRPDAFADIAGSPHADAIRDLEHLGVVGGYGDGTFGPEDPVTRAQMATFLTRRYGLTRTGEHSFPDTGRSVHEENILAAADSGVTDGYPDGTYRPLDEVTRRQMAAFIARVLDLEPGSGCFPDTDNDPQEDAICAVAREGIVEGFPDGTFRPGEKVTRGQTATFLVRAESPA